MRYGPFKRYPAPRTVRISAGDSGRSSSFSRRWRVDVDRTRVAVRAVAPDRPQQLLPVEQASGVAHEAVEQLELRERQLHELAAQRDLAARAVDAHVAGREDILVEAARSGPAEHRADAAAQLGEAERLRHIVIGAGLQAEYGVGLAVARREHDHRYDVAPRPQLAAHGVAVRAGAERDVEQDDVGVVGRRTVERRARVGDRQDAVALALEGSAQHVAQRRLVVHYEDIQRGGLAHVCGGG